MIDFEHGALRRKGEPELAGILAERALGPAETQAMAFLGHCDALTVDEWWRVLERVHISGYQYESGPAARRLRDEIDSRDIGIMLHVLNGRVTEMRLILQRGQDGEYLSSVIERWVSTAAYAVLLRGEVGEKDLAQLYAPFEQFIPLTSLG